MVMTMTTKKTGTKTTTDWDDPHGYFKLFELIYDAVLSITISYTVWYVLQLITT